MKTWRTALRSNLFSAAIGDEVLLSRQAKAVLANYTQPLARSDILKISQHYGIDIATRCYYEYLLQSSHGEFKQQIDSCIVPANTGTMGQDIKLLIVPGLFYKEQPEVGADGQLVSAIARQCGFSVELVETQSKGSISSNVAILAEHIAQQQAANIWLVSMSIGGSQVRHYLQSYKVPDGIKGWLNIAGINQGCPHARRKLSSLPKKLIYAMLCKIMHVDYQLLTELQPEHAIWTAKPWPQEIDCIHVVPIPLRAHLQAMLKKRYEQLLPYGPNDGMTPVYDAEQLPGHIYPLWGIDHFMRMPHISTLLYQFFSYIAQQESTAHNKL